MAWISGFSKINISITEIVPETRNCAHESFTPSTIAEYLSITRICIAKPSEHARASISPLPNVALPPAQSR